MNIITHFNIFLLLFVGLFTFLTETSTVNFSIDGITNSNIQQQEKYGIAGLDAPELSKDIDWIDANGTERAAVQLSDYEGKFTVIYCFQSWCPGCHSRGLPALQNMTKALKDNDKVVFLAIQTVFEGAHINTKDKVLKTQKQYNLSIPFGHDVGNETTMNRASTMQNYRTGGTPWFIFVDQKGQVVFNDFHLDEAKAIEFLKAVE